MHKQIDIIEESYNGRTIKMHLLFLVLSVVLGSGIIYFFTLLGHHLDLRYSDGSKQPVNLLYWFFGLVNIIGTFILGASMQFEHGNDPHQTMKDTSLVSMGIGFFLLIVLNGCFTLTSTSDPKTIFISFGINTIFIWMLGKSLGRMQMISLSLLSFDSSTHLYFLSNEADLVAVRKGCLPYRQYIYLFWQIVGISIGLFLAIGFLVFFVVTEVEEPWVYLFFCALTLLIIFGLFVSIDSFTSPTIKEIDILILSKSIKIDSVKRYIRYYQIRTEYATYKTDKPIWDAIDPNKKYTLWLLNSGKEKKIIGYEQISSQSFK